MILKFVTKNFDGSVMVKTVDKIADCVYSYVNYNKGKETLSNIHFIYGDNTKPNSEEPVDGWCYICGEYENGNGFGFFTNANCYLMNDNGKTIDNLVHNFG